MSSLQAIPTVVDVVTGTDWASIVASIATGVAAIVGIGGTAYLAKRASADAKKSLLAASNDAKADRVAASSDLQASINAAAEQLATSISAEDRRAHVAEKRRIYAAALTALNEAILAAGMFRAACLGDDDKERQVTASRQEKARDRMLEAMAELALIAPPVVGVSALETQGVLSQFMNASEGTPFARSQDPGPELQLMVDMRNVLLSDMRVDLGESAEFTEETGPAQEPQNS